MNDALIHVYITFGSPSLKAMSIEEAGERSLFMEASNEARDHQDEIVSRG